MRIAVVFVVIIGAFTVSGVAQAAGWQVAAGEQARPPAGTPKGATLNSFFPAKLAISAGDSVTFSSATFHTVTYTGGKAPAALFVPDPAKTMYSGLNDAAGNPFYFNGLPKLIYNPAAFAPAGGKNITTGVAASSGVLSPAGPKAPPAKVTYTFPKVGSFQLICNVHPGMKVVVAVKPSGAPLPLSASQVTAQALTQTSAAWAKAKPLAAAPVPANTVYAGVGSTTAILGFLPRVLKVKVGTTVNFVNRSTSEVHNVTFGPTKYLLAFSKQTDLLPAGPGSKNQVTPLYPFGTEPKGAYTYDGKNHGNGFFSTPLTTGSPLVPLPRAAKVTFTGAGTFKYICFLHGTDMAGTVIVTP